MYCPRLDHFVRLNPSGKLSRCGHMTNNPEFDSIDSMDNSEWLAQIKQQFSQDQWPQECIRCQQTEQLNQTSIRLNSIAFHKNQSQLDYLTVGGVLDNVCNSACQTCNETLSTKIGSLHQRDYIKINNADQFWNLPLNRVVHLDVNGGEPSASKNYRHLLANLPDTVCSIRINTNCSTVITELDQLLEKGVNVTITASLDGIGRIHDYVRWPIKFNEFEQNLLKYQSMGVDLNTWTTVSALNIGDLKNIFQYAEHHKLKHSWALLERPNVLSVKYSNHLTRTADVPNLLKSIVATEQDNTVELQMFTAQQDKLRNIRLWDYFK